MSNVVTDTENFAGWTASNVTVTTNTHPAPSIADPGADMADTLEDATASDLSFVVSPGVTIVSDASSWTTSLYVRKDGVTSRFPEFRVQFLGGSTLVSGVIFNTSTGALGPGTVGADIDASGVVDVDANWWRVWYRHANNNAGNTMLKVSVWPASVSSFFGASDPAATGSIVVWGLNQTNTSSVQPYEPNPSYGVTTPPMILIQHV